MNIKNHITKYVPYAFVLLYSLVYINWLSGDLGCLSNVDDNITQWMPIMNASLERFKTTYSVPLYNFFQFGGMEVYDVGYYGLQNPLIYMSFFLAELFGRDVITIYILISFILGNIFVYSLAAIHKLKVYVGIALVIAYSTANAFWIKSYWYYVWENYWIIPLLLFVLIKSRHSKIESIVCGLLLAFSFYLGNIQYTIYLWISYILISFGLWFYNRDYIRVIISNLITAISLSVLEIVLYCQVMSRSASFSQKALFVSNPGFYSNNVDLGHFFIYSIFTKNQIELFAEKFANVINKLNWEVSDAYLICFDGILAILTVLCVLFLKQIIGENNRFKQGILIGTFVTLIFWIWLLGGEKYGLAKALSYVPVINSLRYLDKITLLLPSLFLLPCIYVLKYVQNKERGNHAMFFFTVFLIILNRGGANSSKECILE